MNPNEIETYPDVTAMMANAKMISFLITIVAFSKGAAAYRKLLYALLLLHG